MMIFDGHADLLYDVTKWRQAGEDRVFERRHLPRLQAGQIGGLGLSIWTTVEQDSIWSAHPDWDGWRRTEEMMARAREELAECPWLALVRTAAEARKAQAEGKLFAFLSVEGMEPVGDRLERLEQYAQWGVRMGMLTWNEENLLACGAGGNPDRGLTELGREAVRRMQRLNILPDVSHTSDRSFWDIMDLAEGPVIASHSNCRALCDVRRNLTDEQLRAIRDTGGVVGVNVSHDFVHKEPRQQTAAMLAVMPPTWRRSWDRNTLPAALTSASISAPAMRGARAWRTAVRLRISFLNWNGSAFQRQSGRPSHRKISCGCWNKKESFYAEKLAGDRRFFRFLRTVAKMMERPTEKGLNYSYI